MSAYAERTALDELIPVAEDLAMRGDARASVALAWMIGLRAPREGAG